MGDEDIGIEVVKRRKSSTNRDEHKNDKQIKHKEEIVPSLVFLVENLTFYFSNLLICSLFQIVSKNEFINYFIYHLSCFFSKSFLYIIFYHQRFEITVKYQKITYN